MMSIRSESAKVVRLLSRCLMGFMGAAIFFGLTCLGLFIPSAFAQKTCVPPVSGIPGFSNPRPNWFDSSQPSPDYQATLDDPRWRGSSSHDYGQGSTSDAQFRALTSVEGGSTVLYLSWNVKSTASLVPSFTTMYVGFMPSSLSGGTIVEVTLQTTSTANDVPQQIGSITYYTSTVLNGSGTTNWTTASPTPNWASQNTRIWQSGTNPYSWAVEMRIPVDPTGVNGVNIGDPNNFNLWYETQLAYPPDPSNPVNPLVTYTWPRTTTANPTQFVFQIDQTTFKPTFPDPATWGPYALKDPNSDTSCLNGIDIITANIGTVSAGSYYISLSNPNTFFAKPQNYSNQAVNAGTLTATFRIANWGSQIGDLTANSWKPIPNGANVADTMGVGAAPSPGTAAVGNIQTNWTLSASDKCPFIGASGVTDASGMFIPGDPSCPNPTPTQVLHQCILVQLNGPGVEFIHDSAFHNEEFQKASIVQENAEVSVIGLNPIANGSATRDVYLYVETRNMPAVILSAWKDLFQNLFGPPAQRTDESVRAKIATMSETEINQAVPIFLVHAYHDTGVDIMLADRKKHRLLEPQTSFGYYLYPHAEVLGWQKTLQGATQLAPDYYKLAVPNNGVKQITTRIVAAEVPCSCTNPNCNKSSSPGTPFAMIVGIFALGLVSYRRGSQRR
jgi:hypothetical protein